MRHRVPVPQHERLGALGGVAAQQHRRDGEQLPGHLVHQRSPSRDIPSSAVLVHTS
ncbi:predicted protein [Streptomyces viridosporus ATCC 14672]|uniref:Predicted protein n=1 Tax=Streptomyces viridosporus (strain ATCC 14672 / DSM 40746 / JCM 4963 / KCTC 9882 / NRRL B-12104 / FH 1290) TaxID=566461 RepID=D5ZVF8_STRV1|nr:predicted protein [Streptomyces viridosporus ATCC 14672]